MSVQLLFWGFALDTWRAVFRWCSGRYFWVLGVEVRSSMLCFWITCNKQSLALGIFRSWASLSVLRPSPLTKTLWGLFFQGAPVPKSFLRRGWWILVCHVNKAIFQPDEEFLQDVLLWWGEAAPDERGQQKPREWTSERINTVWRGCKWMWLQ